MSTVDADEVRDIEAAMRRAAPDDDVAARVERYVGSGRAARARRTGMALGFVVAVSAGGAIGALHAALVIGGAVSSCDGFVPSFFQGVVIAAFVVPVAVAVRRAWVRRDVSRFAREPRG